MSDPDDLETIAKNVFSRLTLSTEEFSSLPLMEQMEAFVSAVDWTESWIIALFTFHAVYLAFAVLTRHSIGIQLGLLLTTSLLVFASEYVNSIASAHWQSFASQQYFDEHGVFLTTVYSAPLLITSLFILVNGVYRSAYTMVQLKRRQLRDSKTKKD